MLFVLQALLINFSDTFVGEQYTLHVYDMSDNTLVWSSKDSDPPLRTVYTVSSLVSITFEVWFETYYNGIEFHFDVQGMYP